MNMDMEAGWKSAKPRKKTQAEKRNEKKMKSSYFTQQYEAFGENFINFKNAQEIKKDSYKIFKALADGAIDLEKHTKCFEDPVFVEALRMVSYEKMMYHYATQMGLEQYINSRTMNGLYVDGFIYQNYSEHQRSVQAYTLLFQAFTNIQITHDYIRVLTILMPLLNNYKFSL